MSGHSLLAPSAAHRWIPCPGSIALCQSAPPFGGNKDTALGTAAHWLGEQALRTGKPCSTWVGEVHHVVNEHDASEYWDIPITDEMAEHVQVYVDYCLRRLKEAPGGIGIEMRVDLSDVLGVPDQGGTADCVLADSLITGVLEVIDLKYGHKKVKATDNPQLMLYALGALHYYAEQGIEFETVRLTIAQPRLDNLDSYEMTPGALRGFGGGAAQSARKAMLCVQDGLQGLKSGDIAAVREGGFLNPGEPQCDHCPARATCPALTATVFDTVFEDGNPDNPPYEDHDEAASDTLGERRRLVPLIENWCKAVVAEVQSRTERGEMPHWVLQRGRAGSRAWQDESKAEEILKKSFRLKNDVMYNQKLISPTQAEKVLTDKRYQRLVDEGLIGQSEGKAIAVHESEANPDKIVHVGEMFDDATKPSLDDLL